MNVVYLVQEFADKLAEIAQNVSSKDGFEKYFARAANGFEANKAMKRVLEERLKYRMKRGPGAQTWPKQLSITQYDSLCPSLRCTSQPADVSDQVSVLHRSGERPAIQG